MPHVITWKCKIAQHRHVLSRSYCGHWELKWRSASYRVKRNGIAPPTGGRQNCMRVRRVKVRGKINTETRQWRRHRYFSLSLNDISIKEKERCISCVVIILHCLHEDSWMPSFLPKKPQKYADRDMQEREHQRAFWYSSLFLCGWPADWPRCWLINTSVKDALHQDD